MCVLVGKERSGDVPVEELAQRNTGPRILRSQPVHPAVLVVGDDQPLVGGRNAEAVGHPAHGRVQQKVLSAELVVGQLELTKRPVNDLQR